MLYCDVFILCTGDMWCSMVCYAVLCCDVMCLSAICFDVLGCAVMHGV